jgi:CheY-like chemotaxis protein
MNSRALFARQVRSQCETFCELLACTAGHPAPAQVLDRCKVSIRMLAGSMLVVDLNDWAQLLQSVNALLTVHAQRRLPWDDRIAQLVFELIEKEELLASCHERDGEAAGRNAVPPQEVKALVAEVEALREECETAEPVQTQAPEGATDPERLGRVAVELRAACERVLAAISSEPWQSRSADTITIEDLRRGLGTIEFFAQAMDRIVASVEETVVTPKRDLIPLETALGDFARELVRGTGRTLQIRVQGEGAEMEPALLPDAYWILHTMVADVFERCDEPAMTIEVQARERHGALHWTVRDNGENFFSDSKLDHEDQLAFYPGLRHVVRTLREHRGTLVVEPNGGREARFEFTMPASTQAEALILWDKNGVSLAARAVQVVDVLSTQTDTRRGDAYGEYVVVDGRRVPLLRLETLFPEAPTGGSHIVVLGVLERTVAFYVPGEGTRKAGVVLGDSIPVWKGIPHEVARVDGRRVPLMDAGDILRAYLSITGTLSDDAMPEATGDAFEVTDREADPRQSAHAPDGTAAAAGEGARDVGAEVVVIEQSETTRSVLTEIFSRQRIRAAFVVDVEEALGLIDMNEPRVIISEFRIPTMAAKKIVDRLRETGREIPVLVTTSQSGSTADLLVEKLGAAGYLSKPLSASQVASQLSGYLGALR